MTITPSIKRDYLAKLAANGKRMDGREFDEFRKIELEVNVVSKAEGSARIKIGNTQVVAGIKMDIGEPYPDSPDSGVMTTAVEMIPMASPDFEAGPPRQDAIEIARVVDRGIRESGVIELDKLCIDPGEKVWIVFIDIHIIDYDGNLFDAASLASLAALMTTVVPAERFEIGEDYPLPIKTPPLSCTSVKYNGVIVSDPSLEENEIAEVRLTVATDENGDIRAMQKGLSGSFTVEEIKKIIKASVDNGKKLRERLYESVGK
ncbi:MAG: exosome complex protein Rrp42 [Thermoplasmatales archaeon]|nr:MAG: exosome complex protein Rrp42 [Thermoplasmatales archaeon]